jgi:hypothetical protein
LAIPETVIHLVGQFGRNPAQTTPPFPATYIAARLTQ